MAIPKEPIPSTASHAEGPARASGGTSTARPARQRGTPGRDAALAAVIAGLDLEPIQHAYLQERWLGQLRYLGQSARQAQRRYYSLRLVAILGGVTVPALIGLDVGGSGQGVVRWLAFGLGLLVAVAVALEEFFRFGERWRHFRQQAEVLRSEGWAFLQRSGPVYRRFDTHGEGFRAFVARAEETMRQEVGVYIAEVTRPPAEEQPVGQGRVPTEVRAQEVTPTPPGPNQ